MYVQYIRMYVIINICICEYIIVTYSIRIFIIHELIKVRMYVTCMYVRTYVRISELVHFSLTVGMIPMYRDTVSGDTEEVGS